MTTQIRNYEVKIQGSPEHVWHALTDPKLTEQYYYDTRVESDWKVGSKIFYRDSEGRSILEGNIVQCEPNERLVTTFEPKWAENAPPSSTVIWEIKRAGKHCALHLTHRDLDLDTAQMVEGAWQGILDRLKEVVESKTSSVKQRRV